MNDQTDANATAGRPTVAAYYFPNYHADPRNAARLGAGWTEWDLVRAARPRYPGHRQPKVPAWGYQDEADPAVMAQKIDAAADHGIDAFIVDWYHYADGPFLNRALDEGFLGAANRHRLRFALMWANHDWIELFPARRGVPSALIYPGSIGPDDFDRICDHIIARYFLHPAYWRIDGRPYFSIYELYRLVAGLGGIDQTRAALDRFRAKAVAAGLPGIHLNAITWGVQILPGERQVADPAGLVRALGFDSVGSYVWVHHVGVPAMEHPYTAALADYLRFADQADRQFGLPYHPNVSMGWDASPRACQADPFANVGYPFMNTIGGNTPDRFADALRQVAARLATRPADQRILTFNSWNEWTEGSYLEPDTEHGMAYLEAVRAVFPR
jgi:hypothetical protein